MKELSFYLEKIRKTISSKKENLSFIQNCLTQVAGVTVPSESLSLKDGVLFVSSTPTKKNELFMKKKEILALLREEGLSVTDLR